MMNMKRARIIYNPTSGREIFKKNLPEVLQKLEQAGYETSCHATTCAGDATEAAKVAVERRFDVVIAAGGDGTINEPRTIEGAIDVIVEGVTKPIDLGCVTNDGETHYFVNIAGGGRLTELTYEVPSKLKTMLGQLAYYLKGMEMLPSIKPTSVEIEYDGKFFGGEIMFFLVSLTNSVGGFEKLAPDSSLDDGMFDLIILKKANLAEFIRIATLALRGEHINDPHIIYTKANRVKIHTNDKMQLNLDGEYGGLLPGEFVNLYRHVEIFVPKATAELMEKNEIA